MIHHSALVYGRSSIGSNSHILENVIIGYPHRGILAKIRERGLKIEHFEFQGSIIGDNALIRSNCIIYCDVCIGHNLQTGHNVVIREHMLIGQSVSIGTNSVIEGDSIVGNNVNIQSNVFVPTKTVIGDSVFIGPGAVLTNDRYPPLRDRGKLKGPVLRNGASIGANAILLPGVTIGEGSLIAAGAVVTKDVPSWKLALGCPAQIVDLPDSCECWERKNSIANESRE